MDPPGLPDLPSGAAADSLLGKRSGLLSLRSEAGAAALRSLLERADVLVHGYRPGALDRFGLGAEELAERCPGLVVVTLAAWGPGGPWSGRRGFDSIVQAPSGIAAGESPDAERPGALPCQLLDHGTGYLAAAAALDGLRRQLEAGGTHLRRLSLARTAWWLAGTAGRPAPEPAAGEPWPAGPGGDPTPWMVTLPSPQGPATAVAPPGGLDGRPLAWPSPLTGYGADPPRWAGPN
jgi:hypothetical protein